MNNNHKQEKGVFLEALEYPLREVAGALLQLYDERTCSGLVQHLIGKDQLNKENLTLYLLFLKTYQTRKYFSHRDLRKYLTERYGWKYVKDETERRRRQKLKEEEAPYLRLGPSELTANIRKLFDVKLLGYIAEKSTKKTHNSKRIMRNSLTMSYNIKFFEPSSDPNKLFELKAPEPREFSDEDLITFLENYVFKDKISLVSEKDRDAMEKEISSADYLKLRKGIGLIFKMLEISPNWLLSYYNIQELENQKFQTHLASVDAQRLNKTELAQALRSDTKFNEATLKLKKEMQENVKDVVDAFKVLKSLSSVTKMDDDSKKLYNELLTALKEKSKNTGGEGKWKGRKA